MARRVTNNGGLPLPMYRALSADTYKGGGDISVTSLISPPRIRVLRKFHENEIVEDSSDRIWSLLGSSVHYMLQLSAEGVESLVAEKRLFMPINGIDTPKGPWVWNLSGQPDLYDHVNEELSDYKVTSIWQILGSDNRPSWEAQVNLQALLHRHQGHPVKAGGIVAIIRDWQRTKAKLEKHYPATQVKKIPFAMWEPDEALQYAVNRVKIHQRAERDYVAAGKNPDALPLCTPTERWYRGEAFAVFRQSKQGKKNKKADRLCTTRDEAEKFMTRNAPPKGTSYVGIEERAGVNKRCMEYCDVAMFCPFGRKLKEEAAMKFRLEFVGGEGQPPHPQGEGEQQSEELNFDELDAEGGGEE